MLFAGIDVGSVAAKAVLWNAQQEKIVGHALLPTGWNVREAGLKALEQARGQLPQPERIVATGYGRVSLDFANKVVTEITCHAVGAHHLFPETGIVLDIGGQDSKVISLSAQGSVENFVMNDKCAAGTGRFLQVLLNILNLDFPALEEAAATGVPASISSQCAVFAETEIVGLLARGRPPCDLVAGVFKSIAQRMRALASRLPMHGQCTFTGGLAQSRTFARFLADELSLPVNVPDQPQLVGALGAAILASRG